MDHSFIHSSSQFNWLWCKKFCPNPNTRSNWIFPLFSSNCCCSSPIHAAAVPRSGHSVPDLIPKPPTHPLTHLPTYPLSVCGGVAFTIQCTPVDTHRIPRNVDDDEEEICPLSTPANSSFCRLVIPAAEQVQAIILAIGLKLLTFNKLINSHDTRRRRRSMGRLLFLFPICHSTKLNLISAVYYSFGHSYSMDGMDGRLSVMSLVEGSTRHWQPTT